MLQLHTHLLLYLKMGLDSEFEQFLLDCLDKQRHDLKFASLTRDWMHAAGRHHYSYQQKFFGVPIIQYPGDMIAFQRIIYEIKPELIIETGIARGGCAVMNAAFLLLLDVISGNYCEGEPHRQVVAIDIDIRDHARAALDNSPFSNYITAIQGDSIEPSTLEKVDRIYRQFKSPCKCLVILDSNHTHKHVLAELNSYSRYVSPGSYIIVCDTSIEYDPQGFWDKKDRPWSPGNSPLSAVSQFIETSGEGRGFFRDDTYEHIAMTTVCPGGFLRKLT